MFEVDCWDFIPYFGAVAAFTFCFWLCVKLWHCTADLEHEKLENERLRERLAEEQKRNYDFEQDMDAIMNFHGEMYD